MHRITVTILLAICPALGFAQDVSRTKVAERLAVMHHLQPMEGEWTGEGWIGMVPGERRTFTSKESSSGSSMACS
jgi:hypothetical protein